MSQYKLLRVTADLTDDDDHVLLQTDPSGLADILRGAAEVSRSYDPLKIECVLEWLDVSEDPVITTRGTFDARVMRQMDRPATPGGEVFVDSTTLVGLQAYRPFIIDEIQPGDDFTVLLTNMAPPATTTHARILYREFI